MNKLRKVAIFAAQNYYNMDIRGFITYIQEKQLVALTSSHIEKFDVCIKNGRVSVWITFKKDRITSSYFYDVIRDETSEEQITVTINKINEILK